MYLRPYEQMFLEAMGYDLSGDIPKPPTEPKELPAWLDEYLKQTGTGGSKSSVDSVAHKVEETKTQGEAESPNGRLMIAVCRVVIEELTMEGLDDSVP